MTIEPVSLEPRDPDGKRAKAEKEVSQQLAALRGDEAARRSRLRWVLPLVAVSIGFAIYAVLVATREKPQTRDLAPPSPLVRVLTVSSENLRLSVQARGTVAPRTESDLVAEVRGRVVWVSDDLVVGGLFEAGDDLLRLDQREYRIARDRARANVTLRESEARLASSEADRRRLLEQRGAASASDLEQFENRELVASAFLAEARASFEQAELDFERTVVRAPFTGHVRERSVDVGRFVSPGTKLGRIFAVDYAEVRLPIQTDDLAYLDVELEGARLGTVEGARVALSGRLGGREFVWPARLVRAEAAIDERTRMLHVVARVDDPYALGGIANLDGAPNDRGSLVAAAGSRVPLPSGLFVTAEIEGRAVNDVFVLPLMALRDGNRVFIAEPVAEPFEERDASEDLQPTEGSEALRGKAGRLRVRDVSILRRDRNRVVIDGGLETGDWVLISPLRIYSDGMSLRLIEADDS